MFSTSDIIYSYTRKDAIEDGYQIEVPLETSLEVGFKCPVFVTHPIFHSFVEDNPNPCQNDCLRGLLRQSFNAIKSARAGNQSLLKFKGFTMRTSSGSRTEDVFLQMGPLDIDDDSPALTIMSEDDL